MGKCKFAAIDSPLLLSFVDTIFTILLIRSITDLPSIIRALPSKSCSSIVVANAFRHLQLIRADRKPGSSQERTLNDAARPGSRIPPAHRAWSAALRHQFGVSGSWIAQEGFRWTCADRMMLLGSAGLTLLSLCLICCLLFESARRSSPSLFAALPSKLPAASPVN